MAPAISVVVPVYNGRATLGRCLHSILRQTVQALEVVVVDDGSTDDSAAVARQFGDPRIRVISQPNGGVSVARNRGIAESFAELVAFLDCDDEWYPGFAAAIVELAAAYPEAGLYSTGVRWVCQDGSMVDVCAATAGPGSEGWLPDYFAAPREGSLLCPSCVAIPRKVLRAVGGFAEGEPMGEDLDLWARIAARYPLAASRRILAQFQTDPGERERERALRKPPYPPTLKSLRAILAEGALPPERARRIRRYVDYYALRHLYWQLELDLPGARKVISQERFYGWRPRLEALVLRCLARWVPGHARWSLRWLPGDLLARLRPGERLVIRRPVTGSGTA